MNAKDKKVIVAMASAYKEWPHDSADHVISHVLYAMSNGSDAIYRLLKEYFWRCFDEASNDKNNLHPKA
jgi:hypothetical protein